MYCTHCGTRNEDSYSHCIQCGTKLVAVPVSAPPPPPPLLPSVTRANSLWAVWSMILGILSFCCFSLLTAIPAVILGHKARREIEASDPPLGGEGMATAGLVLGYVNIVLSILLILMLLLIGTFFPSGRNWSY